MLKTVVMTPKLQDCPRHHLGSKQEPQ